MFPEYCVQSIIYPESDWWVVNKEKKICRGALVWAVAHHVDQVPFMFVPVGRKEADLHNSAVVSVEPLKVGKPLKQLELPVAAMPRYENEVWAAYRAKRRPCLVLGSELQTVEEKLINGKPKTSVALTILVAPYYGIDEKAERAGYSEAFIERVRHCSYPQFLWDKLPGSKVNESILRLDHIHPLGTHYMSYDVWDYKLSDDALLILDELINWVIWGGVQQGSLLLEYRKQIEQLFN